MALTEERVKLDTTAAIRAPQGFFFGKGMALHGDRLLVEVDASLEPGDAVEVRLTLAPTDSTALLDAQVVRALVTGAGETPRYAVHVVGVRAVDRPMLDAWVTNQRVGGTFSRFDLLSQAGHDTMRGNTPEEVRAALARVAQRPGTVPANPSTRTLSGLSEGGPGRDAMRDALRRAVLADAAQPVPTPPTTSAPRPPPARPAAPPPFGAPPPPPRPPLHPAPPRPGPSLAPPGLAGVRAPAASAAAVPSTMGGAAVLEPAWSAFSAAGTTWIEARWSSRLAFLQAVEALFRESTVRLHAASVDPPTAGALKFILRFDTLVVEADAQVRAQSNASVVYSLVLGSAAAETLRRHAAATFLD